MQPRKIKVEQQCTTMNKKKTLTCAWEKGHNVPCSWDYQGLRKYIETLRATLRAQLGLDK